MGISKRDTWLRVQPTNNHEHSNRPIQMVEATFWNKISSRDVSKGHEWNVGYASMEDILIAGHNVAHHDSVLEAVLKLTMAKSYNLRLNFEKSNMWATLSQQKDSNQTQKRWKPWRICHLQNQKRMYADSWDPYNTWPIFSQCLHKLKPPFNSSPEKKYSSTGISQRQMHSKSSKICAVKPLC